MASSEYQYYILTQAPKESVARKPGQICCAKLSKIKKHIHKKLDVIFTGSVTGADYPVDRDILLPISFEEAGLLMPLPVEDRLEALHRPQGLRPARRLKEGTEVWVQEGSALLQGTIRYIGSIDKSSAKWDVAGVFYGVELQGSDRGRGNTDGTHRYKQFFSCDKNCGVFAPFNRITAVGAQTSPDPHSKDSSDLKPRVRISLKSKSELRPDSNHDQEQPVSFVSNHFYQDPSHKETSPESRPDLRWDSGPKSLTADPETMDLDHVYEDPDQLLEPSNGSNDKRFMSDKQRHSSDKSKTDRKDKPKERLDLIPGSAKRVTAAIPESSEVDHVNSSSLSSKTRLAISRFHPKLEVRPRSQSESESKAAMLTKTGPESPGVLGCESTETEDMYTDPKGASKSKTDCSRSESKPGGPKPSLENVSTDVLKAGDQVHYFEKGENEQVFEGSVVYMENTEEGMVVHIAGQSGTVIVPLLYVWKAETKRALSDTEDLYMGGDSTVPRVKREERCSSPGPVSVAPPVECREDCSSLGLDSVVEIDLSKGVKGFGTIRWIGFLPGQEHKMAGLELVSQLFITNLFRLDFRLYCHWGELGLA